MKAKITHHWKCFTKWLAKDHIEAEKSLAKSNEIHLKKNHRKEIAELESRVEKYVEHFTRCEIEMKHQPPNDMMRILIEYPYGNAFSKDFTDRDRDCISHFMARKIEREIRCTHLPLPRP